MRSGCGLYNGASPSKALGDVLKTAYGRSYSDTRDVIYSLLGIARSGLLTMAPNYTLSVVCVFSLATRKMILESGALEIFIGADGLGGGPEQSNPGFPSWVPEWSVAIPGRARDSYKAAVDT